MSWLARLMASKIVRQIVADAVLTLATAVVAKLVLNTDRLETNRLEIKDERADS